jgi:hypothetical protein
MTFPLQNPAENKCECGGCAACFYQWQADLEKLNEYSRQRKKIGKKAGLKVTYVEF